jgi:alkylated DNA repair dioxygenase AlkB
VDGELYFGRSFFPLRQSDEFFRDLRAGTAWQQDQMKWFGKQVNIPRLTAWHGDPEKVYRYSGITVAPTPWTPTLLRIKKAIEEASGTTFDSVLLNLYRDGRDSVSWHSGDEPELGTNPVIGSVSFGATRVFNLRHKHDPTRRLRLELSHGSYLLMAGSTQHHWLHEIPKTARPVGERINLTFRTIHGARAR